MTGCSGADVTLAGDHRITRETPDIAGRLPWMPVFEFGIHRRLSAFIGGKWFKVYR
jgi:hypothetical protein